LNVDEFSARATNGILFPISIWSVDARRCQMSNRFLAGKWK
jgi:hypothetical protein